MATVVIKSSEAIKDELIQSIFHAAVEAIGLRGAFYIVISGGSLIEMLASMLTDRYNYSEWHIFLADERIVPLTDENSIYGEFQRRCGSSNKFLSESNFSPPFDANVELDAAAKAYEDQLSDVQFDMVILGMGPDGHTASIFPPVTREMLEE